MIEETSPLQPYVTLDGYRQRIDRDFPEPERLSPRAYSRLDPHAREAYDDHRIAWYRNGFMLGTPTIRVLGRDIRRRLRGWEYGRRETDLMLLDGPAYIGKTTALLAAGREVEERVALQNPDYRTDGIVPVVHVDMAAQATPKSVAEAILDFFPVPYDERKGHVLLADQAIKTLIARRTRLLIVDEFQMLHLEGKSGDQAINALKRIFNHAGAVPVIAGIDIHRLLRSQAADQLMARGTTTYGHMYNYETDEEKDEWRQLLEAMAQEMPLLGSAPSLDRHADLLMQHTRGRLGALRYLLQHLLIDIIEEHEGAEATSTETCREGLTSARIHTVAETIMPTLEQELEQRRVKAMKPGRNRRAA